jgi:SAM-dependent methyltransferase
VPTSPSLDAFVAESPIQRGAIASFVRQYAASLPPGTRILDAGAGVAPYRQLFAHCDYRTQDWSGSVHSGAAEADVVGDLDEGLPIEDGAFDAILCTEVLEHVGDPFRVLAELRRLLRDGGRLALTVPFVGPLHEEPHDHRRPTNHGLVAMLDRTGFTEPEVRPLTGWFSTLASVLRDQGLATQRPGTSAPMVQRLVGLGCYLVSEVLRRLAPTLDRHLDRRQALPLGWSAVAVAGDPAA